MCSASLSLNSLAGFDIVTTYRFNLATPSNGSSPGGYYILQPGDAFFNAGSNFPLFATATINGVTQWTFNQGFAIEQTAAGGSGPVGRIELDGGTVVGPPGSQTVVDEIFSEIQTNNLYTVNPPDFSTRLTYNTQLGDPAFGEISFSPADGGVSSGGEFRINQVAVGQDG